MHKSNTDQKGIIYTVIISMLMIGSLISSGISYAKVKPGNSYTRAVQIEKGKQTYPRELRQTLSSGFVEIVFMVDKNGQVFEPIVVQSTSELIEPSSLKKAQTSVYSPARYNGEPVESLTTIRNYYYVEDATDSVNRKFNRLYKSAMKALNKEPVNKKAVLKQIVRMEETYNKTFYTQSFLYIAKLAFADKFENNESKINAIENLLFFEGRIEKGSKVLAEHLNISIRRRLINLYIKSHRYMDARSEIKKLVKYDPGSKAGLDNLKSQISNIISNDQQVATAFQIHKRGYSSLNLYKNNFTFRDVEGQFDTIKLRCDKKFIEMEFNPTANYEVPDAAGFCIIQIIGEELSTAKLVQY